MTHRALVALLIVALLPCRPVASSPSLAEPAPVTVRGRVVARLYTANAGLSPTERAELAMKRLAALAGRPVAARDIETRPLKDAVGLYLHGELLLVATPAEAAARSLTPAALADRWAGLLRTVLAAEPAAGGPRPPAGSQGAGGVSAGTSPRAGGRTLRLSEARLTLPPGETRAVIVTAGAAPRVETREGGVIEARLEAGARAGQWILRIRGVAAGRAVVRLREADGAATAELPVQVMAYAARVAEPVEVLVTGRPAPEAWVRRRAVERREEALVTEPGARVQWSAPEGAPGDLEPGESKRFAWSARVTAPGRLPVTLRPAVVVRNRALPVRETALLFYSNHPERVLTCGPLYAAPLDEEIPARLLYHHQNGSGRPFVFRVEIENPSDAPAEVQVIEGIAGPTYNTVLVGHLAARRFGENWPADLGVVHTVAPGRSRAIVRARVPDGDTVSGILGLRCLGGGRLQVRVLAEEVEEPVERAVLEATAAGATEHVYPEPRKEVQARYRVGESWAFIPVGKTPIPAHDGSRRLAGNYGVLYEIAVRVENPTDRERTIQVALSRDAGPARGVFWIDDRFVEAPELGADAPLASFRLAPGAARDLPIRTLPVAGSAYPARIVVRAAPLPPAPRAAMTEAPPEAAE